MLASASFEWDSAVFLRARSDELSPAASAALKRIAAEVSTLERDEALHVRVRSWPPALESLAPPTQLLAEHGRIVESLGPFETDDFDLIWFDLFYDVELALVLDAGSGAPLILIPRTSVSLLTGTAEVSHMALAPGTVWMRAQALHSSAPTSGYAGLRIREGSLRFSQPVQVIGGALRAMPGTIVTLQLSLVSAPSPPPSPHGGDARDLRVDTPAAATFIFQVGGAGRLSSAATGRLAVYTSRIELAYESASAEYDADLRRLCFGVSPSPAMLGSADPASQLFMPRGEARIARASWALPVVVAPTGDPASLGDVSGSGGYLLGLDPGLTAKFEPWGMRADHMLVLASLLIESGLLYLRARSKAPLRQELQLWRADAATSRLELSAREELQFLLLALAGPNGGEMLSGEHLHCRAYLDRPIDASGGKPQFHSDRARIVLTSRADELRIHVSALADAPKDPVTGAAQVRSDASFILNNALVRASPAAQLTLSGPLTDRQSVRSGVLQLQLATRFVLPTLPDPYAANISRYAPRRGLPLSERSAGELIASVRWATPEAPTLGFELRQTEAALARVFLPITPAPIEPFSRIDRLALLESHFARTGGQGPEVFRLLDVSSRADLFGVGFNPVGREHRSGAAALTLRGLDLAAPVHDVSAFTLPAFQWEPVYNLATPDALAGFPDKLVSPTDGGATRIATSSTSVVALAPIPVVTTMLEEYGAEPGSVLGARFTLPFGIVASARLETPQQPMLHELPQFTSTAPAFTALGMSGGLQVTLTAAEPSPLQPAGSPGALPGMAIQTDNAGGWNVLKSASVDEMFNDSFAKMTPMAPVERIDVSGYGATTFSNWRRTSSQATGVTQVKFEAMVGRTSKEVVQVRSRLYPWAAVVVRIITMSRTGSAGVFRRDSGWQAASDGDYNLPGCIVHRGVAPRLTNIRRIRDTTNVYERMYGGELVKLVGVLFDADVEVESVTLGANGEGRVPARDIVGYVQVSPTDSKGNLKPLTAEQLSDLLQHTGAIGGPLDCELNIAQSGIHMRLSRLEVDRTETLAGGAQFAAVVRGAAELPLAGQWTFVYRPHDQQDFGPLEPTRPIPLIRANAVAGAPSPCRFADASELHRLTQPKSEYAVLWSGDAQRLLAPQPQLKFSEPILHAGSALLFADMYALAAGGVAIFPRSDLANPLPVGTTLRLTGRRRVRLEIPQQPSLAAGQFRLPAAERTMSQSAAFRFRSRLHPDSTAHLTIDSDQTPNWSCTIGPVSSLADIAGLNELLQVRGELTSSAASAPQLANPRMIFGGPLAPVQKVLHFLSGFGLGFPFDISITNVKYGFKSGWKYVFPKYGLEKLAADLGKLPEIELKGRWGIESEVAKDINKIVAEHSIISTKGTSKAALRGWHFNLEAEAKCHCNVLSLVGILKGNADGVYKFELSGEEDGTTRLSYLFGVGWSGDADVVGIDFSGEHSYGIVFRHFIGKEQLELGGASEWGVEATFGKGLAAAKVSFELIALVERTEDIHFKGEGTLAIDLTVGWVLSKEYEVEFTVDEVLEAVEFAADKVLP
uniref:Uncharacterized protein n=1 Tax=Aromatoleum buckelii TaxID=200254 RepID=A0ABX1N3U0_9RHOO